MEKIASSSSEDTSETARGGTSLNSDTPQMRSASCTKETSETMRGGTASHSLTPQVRSISDGTKSTSETARGGTASTSPTPQVRSISDGTKATSETTRGDTELNSSTPYVRNDTPRLEYSNAPEARMEGHSMPPSPILAPMKESRNLLRTLTGILPREVRGTNGWVYQVDPQPIGVGSFSDVHRCTCDNRDFVVKRQLCYKHHAQLGLNFIKRVCTNLAGLTREVAIYFSDTLSNQNAKHQARLHDIAHFRNKHGDVEQVLVFEWANARHNTLRKWLKRHKCLDTDHSTTLWLRLSFGIQIFSALVELHDGVPIETREVDIAGTPAFMRRTQQRYIHQDLKPQNLLLFTDHDVPYSDRVALTDFGLATQLWARFEVSGCRRASADGVYVEQEDVQPDKHPWYQNQHGVRLHYLPSERMWVIDDPKVNGYSFCCANTDVLRPPLDSHKWTSCDPDEHGRAPRFKRARPVFGGTQRYRAPEQWDHKRAKTPGRDVWAAGLVLADLFRGLDTSTAINAYKTYCDGRRTEPHKLLELAPAIAQAMYVDANAKALRNTPVATVRGKIAAVLSQCFQNEDARPSAAWCRQQLIESWNEVFMPPNSCNGVGFGKTPWFKVEQLLQRPGKPSVGVTGARLIRFHRFRAETAQLKFKIGKRTLNAFRGLGSTITTETERAAWRKEIDLIKQCLDQIKAEGKHAQQQAATREQEFAAAKAFISQRITPGSSFLSDDEVESDEQTFTAKRHPRDESISVTYDTFTKPLLEPGIQDPVTPVSSNTLVVPLLNLDMAGHHRELGIVGGGLRPSAVRFLSLCCDRNFREKCFAGTLSVISVALIVGGEICLLTNRSSMENATSHWLHKNESVKEEFCYVFLFEGIKTDSHLTIPTFNIMLVIVFLAILAWFLCSPTTTLPVRTSGRNRCTRCSTEGLLPQYLNLVKTFAFTDFVSTVVAAGAVAFTPGNYFYQIGCMVLWGLCYGLQVMSILVLFIPMQRVKSSPDDIQFRWPHLWICCIPPIAFIGGQLFPILDKDFEFYPQYAVTLSNAALGEDPTFWHQWFSITIWFGCNGIQVVILLVAYLLYVCQRQDKRDPPGVKQIRCCCNPCQRGTFKCYPRHSLLSFLGALFLFRSMWSITDILLSFQRTEGLCFLGVSYICDRLAFPFVLLLVLMADTALLRKIPIDGDFMTWCNLSDAVHRLRLDDVVLEDVVMNSSKSTKLYNGRFFSVQIAVKKFRLPYSATTAVEEWSSEHRRIKEDIEHYSGLLHRNVIAYFGYCIAARAERSREKLDLWAVMERADRTLFEIFVDRGPAQQRDDLAKHGLHDLVVQVARGLRFLHRKNAHIRRGEICSPNIFVFWHSRQSFILKIALKIRKHTEQAHMQSSVEERASTESASHAAVMAMSAAGDTIETKSEANMMAPSVGTQWLAPEVNPAEPEMRKDDLSPEQWKDRQRSDVFSFGIVIWEILMRFPPPEKMDGQSLFEYHKGAGSIATRRLALPRVHVGLEQLMCNCWDQNPKVRPNLERIHALVSQMKDEEPYPPNIDTKICTGELEMV